MLYIHQMLYDVGKYRLPTKWFQLLQDKSMDKELLQHHITPITAAASLPDWLIQTHGRWSSDSYIISTLGLQTLKLSEE